MIKNIKSPSRGFEPRTLRLKALCSTNWAMTVLEDIKGVCCVPTRNFLRKCQTYVRSSGIEPESQPCSSLSLGRVAFYHWTMGAVMLLWQSINCLPIPGVEPGPKPWKGSILTAGPYRYYREWGSNPRGLWRPRDLKSLSLTTQTSLFLAAVASTVFRWRWRVQFYFCVSVFCTEWDSNPRGLLHTNLSRTP